MIEFYEKMLELMRSGKEFVLVKVVDRKGPAPTETGSSMIVFEDGSIFGTIGGGNLEYEAIKEAKERFKTKENGLKDYKLDEIDMVCGGNVTIYFQVFKARINVFIFGLGHIGISLLYHLKNLGYAVKLIDTREQSIPEYIRVNKYEDFFNENTIREDDFIVIATYSHDEDFKILKEIYKRNLKVKYLAIVASKNKIKIFKEEIMREFGNVDFSFLYSPAGLDIGGKTPDEIAISIISEMQSVRYNKEKVRHLRDDIHNNR
uniref:XdhC family protein n=1 Tax=candidate division WOR-3 bacterium TaxID=2052148 RepID=A0A7C4Y548_UNCW3